MSPSKVALSTSRQTQKTTANFQEGPPKGRPGFTFARAGFGQGGAECRFHLPATRSHVSKYRDPQRNLRNRRMTSFIDHVATINLIWFSARSNMAGDESWPCSSLVHVIIRRFHYFENTLYTCAIVRQTIVANCHLYAVRLSVST